MSNISHHHNSAVKTEEKDGKNQSPTIQNLVKLILEPVRIASWQ